MIKSFCYGRLAADPELKTTNGNASYCTFKMAADTIDYDAEHRRNLTIFPEVTVWGKAGENVAKYLHKGDAVVVEGDLCVQDWKGRSGDNRYTIRIKNASVQFGERSRNNAPAPQDEDDDDMLPDD